MPAFPVSSSIASSLRASASRSAMRSLLRPLPFRCKLATDAEVPLARPPTPAVDLPPPNEDDNDNRWSDVVPPQSALVFAVVWGPDDDIVTFSEADLFNLGEVDLDLGQAPYRHHPFSKAHEDQNRSHIWTPGRSSVPLSAHPSTLAFFRDGHEHLFPSQSQLQLQYQGQAQAQWAGGVLARARASSTLGGCDVYMRSSVLAWPIPVYYSCLEDMDVDGHRERGRVSFSDEGYCEGRAPVPGEVVLSSAFSTTTTSTSNYISVDPDDARSAFWSTLDMPTTPGFANSHIENQRLMGRKLKKPHREACTHTHEMDLSVTLSAPRSGGVHPRAARLARLVRGVRPWKILSPAAEDEEEWVLVNISDVWCDCHRGY